MIVSTIDPPWRSLEDHGNFVKGIHSMKAYWIQKLESSHPATISVCLLGVTTTACTAAPGQTAASAEPTPSTWTSTAARPAGPAPAASRTEPARTRIKVALYYIVLTPNNVLWSDCGTWGKKGFCRSGQYVNYMKQNCKKTCKLCWWLYCNELCTLFTIQLKNISITRKLCSKKV